MTASASRLLGRLARRDCDISHVTGLIEKDPVLSAQVVRSANSAAFQRLQQVESVRHAVVMVGLSSVRRFALSRTISNLFSRPSRSSVFSLTRFNLHSVAVGTLMELLADEVPLEERDAAFLCGLLHDVGKLLIAIAMPDQYKKVLEVVAVSGDPLVACETAVLETNHAELSAMALERWGLPESVQAAVALHHDPDSAAPSAGVPPTRVSLSRALHQADLLIKGLGMSVEPPKLTADIAPAIEFEGFEINQNRLSERFAFEWKATDAMLR